MSIQLHKCWTCGTSLLGLDLTDDSFFWCSQGCQTAYEASIAARLTQPTEPEAAPPVTISGEEEETPARVFAGATKRQKTCGRCGGKGHNARTCKGRAKAVTEKVVKVVSSAPKGATKISGRGGPGKQKTCGKCGAKGHNARTCKS